MPDDDVSVDDIQPPAEADALAQLGAAAEAALRRGSSANAVPLDFTGRLWTFLVDQLFQNLALPLIALAIGWLLAWIVSIDTGMGLSIGFIYLVWLGYGATEIWAGQTPGKLLTDVRVRRRDGIRATRPRLVARWAIRRCPELLLGLLLPINAVSSATSSSALDLIADSIRYTALAAWMVVVLGCLAAAFTNGLALHDLLTGTAVFREVDVFRRSATLGEPQSSFRGFEVKPPTPEQA